MWGVTRTCITLRCNTSPKTVSQGHHQRRLAERFATMRHTPLAVLRSGQHRQLPRGQAPQQAERRHHPAKRLVFAKHCPQESGNGVRGRTMAVAGFWGCICSSPALHATLHGHEMGTPSSRASRASALRPASRWLAWGSGVRLPACAGGVSDPGRMGGVTPVERRKGSNRAKVTRPWWRHGRPVRSCAWCAHPVHGDAVTVTFPDKAQATFHVACLDQYRAVLWPRTAP